MKYPCRECSMIADLQQQIEATTSRVTTWYHDNAALVRRGAIWFDLET